MPILVNTLVAVDGAEKRKGREDACDKDDGREGGVGSS
jgi:hypothetical protein